MGGFFSSFPLPLPPSPSLSLGLAMPAGSRVLLESPASSELNEEDESPEVEVDFMDDYDSEEERKQRRRSRKVSFFSKQLSLRALFVFCLLV